MAAPRVPSGLSDAGKKLWRDTVAVYVLRADELVILKDACREADLVSRMEADLRTSDLLIEGSMGQKVVHPLLSEVRQHRVTMAALLRGLKLPDDAGAGQTNQQREAAQSRWASAHSKAS